MPGEFVFHSVNQRVTRVLTENVEDMPDIPDMCDICADADGIADAASAVPVACDMCMWSMVKRVFW